MLSIKKKYKTGILAIAAIAVTASCNKIPGVEPIATTPVTGSSILAIISADTTYSILKASVDKASTNTTFGSRLDSVLNNKTNKLTLFALDNNAFRITAPALGIPASSAAAIPSLLRAGQLDTLLRYHIIPQNVPAAAIPLAKADTILNLQMPTLFRLAPPFVQMNIYPSRKGAGAWANTTPIIQTDIAAANGTIHKVAYLVAPPTLALAQIIYADPQFSLLTAAIIRGDSGQVGLNRIDSVLKTPVGPNITVFAPTNAAFNAIGFTSAAAINATPVQTIRGIVVYHVLGTRAFSVNLPTVTTSVRTLLPPPFPPLVFDYSTGGLKLKAAGYVTGEPLANITTADKNGINGVVHIIDKVLRPQ
jgi:uncharacterized surface protein with fasciclin (FAS1) repeats